MSRRDWLARFADPAVLSDLFAAARDCHAEADDCDPELCAHSEMLMMPIGLPQWIEEQVHASNRSPVRLDHRENREAGWHGRRGPQLEMAG